MLPQCRGPGIQLSWSPPWTKGIVPASTSVVVTREAVDGRAGPRSRRASAPARLRPCGGLLVAPVRQVLGQVGRYQGVERDALALGLRRKPAMERTWEAEQQPPAVCGGRGRSRQRPALFLIRCDGQFQRPLRLGQGRAAGSPDAGHAGEVRAGGDIGAVRFTPSDLKSVISHLPILLGGRRPLVDRREQLLDLVAYRLAVIILKVHKSAICRMLIDTAAALLPCENEAVALRQAAQLREARLVGEVRAAPARAWLRWRAVTPGDALFPRRVTPITAITSERPRMVTMVTTIPSLLGGDEIR